MILIHEAMNRGHTDMGWLKSDHSFSFGGFLDPTRMGYGALRVINEDRIVPGSGFGEHGHQDMDILTLVLSGELKHADTLGNIATIAPGDAQLMSAGSGIRHSEMNASDTNPAHFLQIWLIPETKGASPTYQQTALPLKDRSTDWTLVASGDAGDKALQLLSDTRVSIAWPREGMTTQIPNDTGRIYFVQIIEGLATVEGERLGAGDGLQIGAESMPDLQWVTDGQALLFDMHQ
ncbi:redox-sensitive bicupin YhaK (pirin superfamily) [Agrobacterium vitis]|nr:redox-sensitive bicupin YhaK (pirin superfamily) [Agrobacterium vitis]MBE1436319.1 redox-sensitive bicupin YhaK (pirin superfamily) [Agrobacterium vitis]